MRRTGRQPCKLGRYVFDFQPGGVVSATPYEGPAIDKGYGRQPVTVTGALGLRSQGNVSAVSSGEPRGRYSGLAGVYSGDRHYFGPAGDPEWYFEPGEDFTFSALAVTHFASGNRAYFFGLPTSGGAGGTLAVGHNSSYQHVVSFAGGTGTGSNKSWNGPTAVQGEVMRYDVCRTNGNFYCFFNGQIPNSGTIQGTYDVGTHIHTGICAVGGLGSYLSSHGGSYGVSWAGTVEKCVLIKGVGLYAAPFDPYDLRPFRMAALRR